MKLDSTCLGSRVGAINTARLRFDDKVAESANDRVHSAARARDGDRRAMERAGIADVALGSTRSRRTTASQRPSTWRSITSASRPLARAGRLSKSGEIALGGKIPINPSGGLIGAGHPVGATGVRQTLDAHKQVTGQAGEYQVEGAKNVQTLNIGGSGTTSVSFVVGT